MKADGGEKGNGDGMRLNFTDPVSPVQNNYVSRAGLRQDTSFGSSTEGEARPRAHRSY